MRQMTQPAWLIWAGSGRSQPGVPAEVAGTPRL